MRALALTLFLPATLIAAIAVATQPPTAIHQAGYCAIRGHCGKKSFFGGELPCPDNGPAEIPSDSVREKLVSICGDDWADTAVCCDEKQLADLRSNLKRVEPLISSCPACKANFFNLFCTFTCSPDQSLFLNVTATDTSTSKKDIISEVDYFVSEKYGSGFFDSCKDVKYSVTNGNAMDLIGGGAKEYPAFLKFLGDKKPFGSPFQMNFPSPEVELPSSMERMNTPPKRCDGDDINYRCSCVDCPKTCPKLPSLKKDKVCKVGHVPCLSLIAVAIYSAFLFVFVSGYAARLAWIKRKESKRGGSRLLHESQREEDDEGGLISDVTSWDVPPKEYALNSYLDNFFSKLGGTCASYPALTIGISFLVVVLMSLGWLRFQVETDPVRLWVAPQSDAAQEKAFFDEKFGPFFRTQQAMLVNDTKSDGPSPVLSYETLQWWFDVEERIKRLKSPQGVTLDDVCYRPTDEGCVVQSITGYFTGSYEGLKPTTWKNTVTSCASMPVQEQCLPTFGQPIKKDMILGGWEKTGDVLDSKALIVTWVVTNWADGTEEVNKAMDWENTLKHTMLGVQEEANERGLRLSFSTEVSLEQELNKSTNTDAKIVVISYIAMFIYASIALGGTSFLYYGFTNDRKWIFVDSKFTLGVAGIVIVLMSVSASVGLFSAMGIKVTLIIAEVIPFLVLAIGVDNIFLIVHEFDKVNNTFGTTETVESRIAVALGQMGPSILLSALTEFIAFALGAAVTMPAVRNFAIYAAGAVLINAILQVTMFIAVLALNQKRIESNRVDCIPCIKLTSDDGREESRSLLLGQPANGTGNSWSRNGVSSNHEGVIDKFVRKKYAPFLLSRKVQVVVLIFFLGLFTAGVSLLPKVKLGLDQRIALPSDSYLIDYFNDLDSYFGIGPPVYFVTREYNVTSRHGQKALCGRFSTCDSFSLANVLEQERKRAAVSYIAEPAASWIDDYFLWLDPALETCCNINKRTGKVCGEFDPPRQCKVCFKDRVPPWNITLSGMPKGEEFLQYLKTWLDAPTGESCPLAGRAGYSHAVVPNYEKLTIEASHFRTSHPPLRSQDDFIKAYAQARRISSTISKKTGVPVFPYSKFYIFFDQYANIRDLTLTLVSAALLSICVVAAVFLGSLQTALVVTFTVAMIVVDIMGCMALFNVSLNAVSLVNLVIAVGISVEFCSHIARAFQFPNQNGLLVSDATGSAGSYPNRFNGSGKPVNTGTTSRAYSALVSVGGSVFTGITLTKFLGVSVLAFTRSKIFEIYYFRMWVSLVVLGAAHALIWLPVALSIAGGEGWASKEIGSEAEDLRGRSRAVEESDVEYDSDDDDDIARGRARDR